ncbi:MAG: hypothetical protein KC561_10300 [Myxococcales bacterium]|nr:hypothetical protein [Myxococcales bacterium]
MNTAKKIALVSALLFIAFAAIPTWDANGSLNAMSAFQRHSDFSGLLALGIGLVLLVTLSIDRIPKIVAGSIAILAAAAVTFGLVKHDGLLATSTFLDNMLTFWGLWPIATGLIAAGAQFACRYTAARQARIVAIAAWGLHLASYVVPGFRVATLVTDAGGYFSDGLAGIVYWGSQVALLIAAVGSIATGLSAVKSRTTATASAAAVIPALLASAAPALVLLSYLFGNDVFEYLLADGIRDTLAVLGVGLAASAGFGMMLANLGQSSSSEQTVNPDVATA